MEITPSVMSDLARERSSGQSSVVIDDDDEIDVDDEEGHHHHHHRRKRYNWFRAVFETIKLGPVACLYYVLFFSVIGNV